MKHLSGWDPKPTYLMKRSILLKLFLRFTWTVVFERREPHLMIWILGFSYFVECCEGIHRADSFISQALVVSSVGCPGSCSFKEYFSALWPTKILLGRRKTDMPAMSLF